MMKLINFEVSKRSLAIKTVKNARGEWNCVISTSLDAGDSQIPVPTQKHTRFEGICCSYAILEKAVDFRIAFL